ncbi:hypothetical protein B296_00011434 [Ensete ventricosum]|uniref:Uncharacterized protein n=1 Tax=Ensete ventricosum TaxID=4639 RepID=A0A426YW32_ENSVE|nr:hypothetical protein B296_00011434 [Ensete ventricosum]
MLRLLTWSGHLAGKEPAKATRKELAEGHPAGKEPTERHPTRKEPEAVGKKPTGKELEAVGKKLAGEYPVGIEERLVSVAPPIRSHPWVGAAATHPRLKLPIAEARTSHQEAAVPNANRNHEKYKRKQSTSASAREFTGKTSP